MALASRIKNRLKKFSCDWNAISNIDQLHAMPEDIFDILDFWQSFKFSLTSHIQRY